MLKHVWQVGSHIQDVFNAVFAKDIQVGRIFGTAKVQVR